MKLTNRRRMIRLLALTMLLVSVSCGQRGTAPPDPSKSPLDINESPSSGAENPGTASPVCGAYGCLPSPGQGGGSSPLSPSGHADGTTMVGTRSATGDHAVAYAYGNVDHPARITATFEAKPNQGINGGWTISCSKGSEQRSGTDVVAGKTPLEVRITIPLANPDKCTASAVAALEGSGTITVSLLASVT